MSEESRQDTVVVEPWPRARESLRHADKVRAILAGMPRPAGSVDPVLPALHALPAPEPAVTDGVPAPEESAPEEPASAAAEADRPAAPQAILWVPASARGAEPVVGAHAPPPAPVAPMVTTGWEDPQRTGGGRRRRGAAVEMAVTVPPRPRRTRRVLLAVLLVVVLAAAAVAALAWRTHRLHLPHIAAPVAAVVAPLPGPTTPGSA